MQGARGQRGAGRLATETGLECGGHHDVGHSAQHDLGHGPRDDGQTDDHNDHGHDHGHGHGESDFDHGQDQDHDFESGEITPLLGAETSVVASKNTGLRMHGVKSEPRPRRGRSALASPTNKQSKTRFARITDEDMYLTTGLSLRLVFLTALQLVYVLGLLAVSHISTSVAAGSEGLHAVADLLSYIFALLAHVYSRKARSGQYPFGLHRLRVIGGMMNGLFLLTASVLMLLGILSNVIGGEGDVHTHHPELVFWMAVTGVLVNLMGTFLLCCTGGEHGHAHFHGHSHGHDHFHSHSHAHAHEHGGRQSEPTGNIQRSSSSQSSRCCACCDMSGDSNIKGAVVHLIADCLSDCIMAVSIFVEHFTTLPGRQYADTVGGIIIVFMCFSFGFPLVTSTFGILLQRPPAHVNIRELENEMHDIPGITYLEDLSIWQVTPITHLIGSVKVGVTAKDGCAVNDAALREKVRTIFEGHGVLNTTIEVDRTKSAVNSV